MRKPPCTPRRFGLLYFFIGVVLLIPCIVSGAVLKKATLWLLFLYPSLAFLVMGGVYLLDATRGPIVLGVSRTSGRLGWISFVVLFPYLLVHYSVWMIRHATCLRGEKPFDEIAPDLYLGRYPKRWGRGAPAFPEEATVVVSLAAEMPPPRTLVSGRRVFILPTLDFCAPNVEELVEVGSALARMRRPSGPEQFLARLSSEADLEGEGNPLYGAAYVYCANGRGRSATLMAVVLVMRGDAENVPQALARMRSIRPQVNMKPIQLKAAEDAVEKWRRSGGQEKLMRARNARLKTPASAHRLSSRGVAAAQTMEKTRLSFDTESDEINSAGHEKDPNKRAVCDEPAPSALVST